jgi:DNA-binding transcriptional LysR family regulator
MDKNSGSAISRADDILDPITFDQIRVFLAVVEEGSFSAAARRLRRAQSAVSYAIANLEGQLGVPLFERSNQRPALTLSGRALVEDARKVAGDVDALRARAHGLSRGLETELAIVVDVMFPTSRLVEALGEFRAAFPSVPPRLYVEALGSVAQLVLDGVCEVGVLGSMPEIPQSLVGEALAPAELVAVAAPAHPLARLDGAIPTAALREEVQLVLTDRSRMTEGRDYGVWGLRTWRLGDLGAKHAMLLAGLGWGLMPRHIVEPDLRARRLVRLRPAELDGDTRLLPLYVIRRADAALGPAATWMVGHLKASCAGAASRASPPA